MLMFTPGMTAPLVSITVPDKEVVLVCAKALEEPTLNNRARRTVALYWVSRLFRIADKFLQDMGTNSIGAKLELKARVPWRVNRHTQAALIYR